jgi:hypothetical protein
VHTHTRAISTSSLQLPGAPLSPLAVVGRWPLRWSSALRRRGRLVRRRSRILPCSLLLPPCHPCSVGCGRLSAAAAAAGERGLRWPRRRRRRHLCLCHAPQLQLAEWRVCTAPSLRRRRALEHGQQPRLQRGQPAAGRGGQRGAAQQERGLDLLHHLSHHWLHRSLTNRRLPPMQSPSHAQHHLSRAMHMRWCVG